MNVYVGNRLPSTYQEVEYIQSSGTQYINTSIKLNNTNWIELKARLTGANNNWDKLYGGGNANSCLLMQWNNDSTATSDIKNKISITNYNNDYNQYKVFSTSVIQQGDIHTYKHTNTAFYIDGVLQGTCNASTFTMGTGLNIFANSNSNGTGRQKSIYALYYMKIYNSSNNIVYDFVPCYRKSDSVIGLYDLVNKQFYTNSGTGTFSKGSDVLTNAELKNAYIGEVYEYSYDFRGKTISQLTADGFIVGSGGSCDSEGFYTNSNWSSYTDLNIPSLTGASKITLSTQFKVSSSYGHSIYVLDAQSSNFGWFYNQSGGNYIIQSNSTSFSTSLSGTVTAELILYFKNMTWSFKVGSINSNGTLTTPASSYNNTYIRFKANNDSGSARLQKLTFIVE